MNAILGYSDRMLKHIDDKDIVADSAEKIKSSGGYLLDLINDVLDMARIESNQITLMRKFTIFVKRHFFFVMSLTLP